MTTWQLALTLNSREEVTGGSPDALCSAISRGADLRIYTEFIHNEHIDPTSANDESVREVSEFRATYLLEGRWTAGIMTLRQPISLPDGFGPRASMSFFLYNQDGTQAIARPYLDGGQASGTLGPSDLDDWSAYPKYHQQDAWDRGTNAPSSNFVYDFEVFRYYVRDDWTELLAHDDSGGVLSGSIDALSAAFEAGAEVKVGIRNLCHDLGADLDPPVEHEVFIQVGPGYYYSGQKLLIGGTHPLVRVRPGIPLRFASRGWDFGWLMPRTDGRVAMLLYDPYTLQDRRQEGQFAVRWFVR
jgi:hypothetical protein